MIKSWGFEFFPAAGGDLEENYQPDKSVEFNKSQSVDAQKMIDYFNFYLDLWTSAEEWGYDGVFLSEHHFGGGYSPSPNLILPVIADRTKTLRLGVMGNVLPYHTPWRIMEEIGMLDVLTGGRLEVGTSAGIPAEFQRIGMETSEARARYDEALEIIDAYMKQPVVTHSGKYWNLNELPLAPRPIQQPAPPMWTTVISEDSARKAARRGSKISTGFLPTDDVKKVFDAYNEEADKAGNPTGPDQLGLRRQVIIDLNDGTTEARADQYSKAFRNLLETFDKRTIAPGKKALDAPGTHGYSLGDDEFIAGAAKEVAEQIIDQCQRSGCGHFLVTFAGHQNLEELRRAWEIYGTQVTPLLKQA
jgi:alkanesulfonate monooxygenase SsuD/methylene tetrahydromethanopterin reductase-like flavin-dependent oxidoreductase (luciferase family)